MTDLNPPLLFCDIEASGLGEGSYPIEIAIAEMRGDTHHWLIDPSSVSGWTHWDSAAEKVHGLSKWELIDWGESAGDVATQIFPLIQGRRLMSDNPEVDHAWLTVLFDAAGMVMPDVQFIDAIESCRTTLARVEEDRHDRDERLFNLKQWARAMHVPKHRAKPDALYLRRLYGLVDQAVAGGNLRPISSST